MNHANAALAKHATPGLMRDITTLELSQQMAPGWSLGNPLEAIGSDTACGSPSVTQALLDAVKAGGYNTVRIPVSWERHADADDNIDAHWMAHVTEVVNCARNAGLYVILNNQSDGRWMQPTYARQAAGNARITRFWTQIANNFTNHDDHLLFAAHNKVMVHGDSIAPTYEHWTVQKAFDQAFVSAVRATGGNNARRHLVVPGCVADIEHTHNHFAVPIDTVSSRLMVEVHHDNPSSFAAGTAQFNKLKQRFIDGLGMPVLVGGSTSVARLNAAGAAGERRGWNRQIISAAHTRGLVPMYWDNGHAGHPTTGLANRWMAAHSHAGLNGTIVNAPQ